MKTKKLRRTCLLSCAGLLFVLFACQPSDKKKDDGNVNPVITHILKRKSVRHYISRPVEDEKIDLLLRAGMAAPSARDLRPWEFVVIKQRSTLDSLAAALPFGKMLAEAPAAIVVCGDTVHSSRLWIEDCAMAAQNILLAAESLDLGAVFTAVYPYEDRLAVVCKYMRLPKHIVPLTVIPLGYPKGKQTPKDKFDEKKIHYETYPN